MEGEEEREKQRQRRLEIYKKIFDSCTEQVKPLALPVEEKVARLQQCVREELTWPEPSPITHAQAEDVSAQELARAKAFAAELEQEAAKALSQESRELFIADMLNMLPPKMQALVRRQLAPVPGPAPPGAALPPAEVEQAKAYASHCEAEAGKALTKDSRQAFEEFCLRSVPERLRGTVYRLLHPESAPAPPLPPITPQSAQAAREALRAAVAPELARIEAARQVCEREAQKATTPEERAALRAFCDRAFPHAPTLLEAEEEFEYHSSGELEEPVADATGLLRGTRGYTYSTALTVPRLIQEEMIQFIIDLVHTDAALVEAWKARWQAEEQHDRKRKPKKRRRKFIALWREAFEEGDLIYLAEFLRKRDAAWVQRVKEDYWTKLIAWRLYSRLVRIYERVFARGVAYYCKKVREHLSCQKMTHPAFFEFYTVPPRVEEVPIKEGTKMGRWHLPPKDHGWLRQWGIRKYHWSASKLEELAYFGLHASASAGRDIYEKLGMFTEFLLEETNREAVPGYMLTGYLPSHCRYEIAWQWSGPGRREEAAITPGWVRDITVGWRRRLDKSLPPAFQMESVPAQTRALRDALATIIKGNAALAPTGELTAADRQILKTLAKKRLLHLLIHPARAIPKGLLMEGRFGYYSRAIALQAYLRNEYGAIRRALGGTGGATYAEILQTVYPAGMRLARAEVESALTEVMAEAEASIQRLKSRKGTAKVVESREMFVENCALLRDPAVQDRLFQEDLFEEIVPAAKQHLALGTIIGRLKVPLPVQTKAGSTIMKDITLTSHLRNRGLKNRLLGVLGAVIARACFQKYFQKGKPVEDSVQELVAQMTPDTVLTAPFCAAQKGTKRNAGVEKKKSVEEKRQKKVFPLELAAVNNNMPPIYVQDSFSRLAQHLRNHLLTSETENPALVFVLTAGESGRGPWQPVGTFLKEVLEDEQKKGQGLTKAEQDYLKELFDSKKLREMIDTHFQIVPPEARNHMGAGLPMEALLSPTMCRVLAHNDVQLNAARVMPPAPATEKVVVNLVFSGPAESFAPQVDFLAAAPREKGQQQDPPKAHYTAHPYRPLIPNRMLGVDFNRPSAYIAEVAIHDRGALPRGDIIVPEPILRDHLRETYKIAQKLRWVDYQGLFKVLFGRHDLQLGKRAVVGCDVGALLDETPDGANIRSALQTALDTYVLPQWAQDPLLQQWDHQDLLKEVILHLRQQHSKTKGTPDQARYAAALRYLRFAERVFARGVYAETRAVQRALAVDEADLTALDQDLRNYASLRGRLLHELFRVPPTQYATVERARHLTPVAVCAHLRARVGRLRTQLTLLHRRKARLKAQLDREVELALARLAIRYGVDGIAGEELTLTTREQPKVLAKYITDMPKRPEILKGVAKRVSRYHTLWQKTPVEVRPWFIDPRGTSQIHVVCGTALQAFPGTADWQYCPKCQVRVRRHGNSAQEIARRGENKRQEGSVAGS